MIKDPSPTVVACHPQVISASEDVLVEAIVDLYCERVAPGLWGEPLNAWTNVAFLVAAWDLRRRALPKSRATGKDLAALPLLIALIGIASGLFHTTASAWAGALDSGFIALYMLVYVCVFTHRVGRLPWRVAWLAAPAFVAFAAAVMVSARAASDPRLQGIGLYLAAWLGLCMLCAWAARVGHSARRPMVLAATSFALSLVLRQVDVPLCDAWPWGTHFVWHLLNALTLWLSASAVYESEQAQSPRGSTAEALESR